VAFPLAQVLRELLPSSGESIPNLSTDETVIGGKAKNRA
jgi:hypothetical protein